MVKTEFSIKDLENLSNVKAHTIRIWEKRYNLLEPNRTDTNIRRYDMENLKKLLNIALLYNSGHKISNLAHMDHGEIQSLMEKETGAGATTFALESFRSAMLTFDGEKFEVTLKDLLKKTSFSNIYSKVFVPLLTHAGLLWQSGTVDPSHEHFVSQKIKHGLIVQTDKAKKTSPVKDTPEFVLFLPWGELHEIGLLYAYYELVQHGFKTLYLGANMPTESLLPLLKQKSQVVFVTYFTTHPKMEDHEAYQRNFRKLLGTENELWILGNRNFQGESDNIHQKKFQDIESFKDYLQKIKTRS